MENRITILVTLKLIENQLDDLRSTVKDLQAHCLKTENGMLQYDWYISDDKKTIKVFETYVNSEAVLFHFDNYKSFSTQLNESRTFVSMEIYGNASEALTRRVSKITPSNYAVIASLNKLK